MNLYRITTPNACAGVLVDGEQIVKTAPILRRWLGCRIETLVLEAVIRRWKIERLS